jgi:hypothetical protein
MIDLLARPLPRAMSAKHVAAIVPRIGSRLRTAPGNSENHSLRNRTLEITQSEIERKGVVT